MTARLSGLDFDFVLRLIIRVVFVVIVTLARASNLQGPSDTILLCLFKPLVSASELAGDLEPVFTVRLALGAGDSVFVVVDIRSQVSPVVGVSVSTVV